MKKSFLFVVAAIYSAVLSAQEAETKEIDVNINTEGGAWYASPWVWVLGAAVFILILVALTRGNNRNRN